MPPRGHQPKYGALLSAPHDGGGCGEPRQRDGVEHARRGAEEPGAVLSGAVDVQPRLGERRGGPHAHRRRVHGAAEGGEVDAVHVVHLEQHAAPPPDGLLHLGGAAAHLLRHGNHAAHARLGHRLPRGAVFI